MAGRGAVGVGVAAGLDVAGRGTVDVGAGVGTAVSSRLQAIKEYSVPAVAAVKPRATIRRINSRRASAISWLPPLHSSV